MLKSIVGSKWRKPKRMPNMEVASGNGAAEWVDRAISPGIKSRERALEKVRDEYGGRVELLRDVSRMTLEYLDCTRMAAAARDEMGANGMAIGTIKNR